MRNNEIQLKKKPYIPYTHQNITLIIIDLVIQNMRNNEIQLKKKPYIPYTHQNNNKFVSLIHTLTIIH